MSFAQKFRNKVLENYNSHRWYFFVKLFIIVLLFAIIIGSFFSVFILISNKAEFWELLGTLKKSFIFIVVRFILNWVVELIFFPSWKIEDNMETLPSKVSWKKTLVQYELSKEITPSEAAILLYRREELSNLICIVYWWINSNIVKLYNEDGIKHIKALHRLWEDVPLYEKYLFNKLFRWKEGDDIVFDRDLLSENKDRVNDMIVFSCEKKWYIWKIEDTVWYNSKTIGCWFSILTLMIWFLCGLWFVSWNILLWASLLILCYILSAIGKKFLGNSSKLKKRESNGGVSFMLFILWISCFTFFINWEILLWISILIIIFLIGSYKDKNESYDIVLTDKWKKMLADIIWYKYYLENCEEEEINANLWENGTYTKNLPYAIALKLNWKVISELY